MEKRLSTTKWFAPLIGVAVFIILMMASAVTVMAAPQHGFGTGQGRTDTVNENDYHTAAWERFWFNYHFVSGSDHRFELGRPTQFNGMVPVDVFTANFRSDAQVALRPPRYGIFSGQFHTPPANWFFQQPVNPNFRVMEWDNPNIDPRFDTLGQGVNSNSSTGNQGGGNGGFLPPTSIR